MFRAILCSSSGGQIVLLQHLVSSLSVNGRTVCRSRADLVNLTLDDKIDKKIAQECDEPHTALSIAEFIECIVYLITPK